MLHAVLEETERAFVEVEQHTNTFALVDVACVIVSPFPVAVETASIVTDEPAASALPTSVLYCRVAVYAAEIQPHASHPSIL
jgi:hypothetical protein